MKAKEGPRLFIGVMPGGIVYSDRWREEDGDYKRLAFLSFSTLELKLWTRSHALIAVIKEDAAKIQAMRGQQYQTSTSGQSVTLGVPMPSVKGNDEA